MRSLSLNTVLKIPDKNVVPFNVDLCLFCQKRPALLDPRNITERKKRGRKTDVVKDFQDFIDSCYLHHEKQTEKYERMHKYFKGKTAAQLISEGCRYHYECRRTFNRDKFETSL